MQSGALVVGPGDPRMGESLSLALPQHLEPRGVLRRRSHECLNRRELTNRLSSLCAQAASSVDGAAATASSPASSSSTR